MGCFYLFIYLVSFPYFDADVKEVNCNPRLLTVSLSEEGLSWQCLREAGGSKGQMMSIMRSLWLGRVEIPVERAGFSKEGVEHERWILAR